MMTHNAAALSGGAVCWDAKRHLQTVTSRSSALFGVFYTNDALFSLLLLSFKDPLILFCSTPIKGVLNARAAPLRSAGTVFCLCSRRTINIRITLYTDLKQNLFVE
jgi:hypothetical protein